MERAFSCATDFHPAAVSQSAVRRVRIALRSTSSPVQLHCVGCRLRKLTLTAPEDVAQRMRQRADTA